jgi:hypothetical protein
LWQRAVKKLLRSRVLRFTGLSRGSQETVAQIATYGIIFFGTMVVLQLWGLDLSSLTIFASVLGVGIGLGLQGIAKEFISGLVLIFERPIKVGDFVNVGDLDGNRRAHQRPQHRNPARWMKSQSSSQFPLSGRGSRQLDSPQSCFSLKTARECRLWLEPNYRAVCFD